MRCDFSSVNAHHPIGRSGGFIIKHVRFNRRGFSVCSSLYLSTLLGEFQFSVAQTEIDPQPTGLATMVLFMSFYLPLILWYAYITISVLSFRTKQLHPRQHRLLLFSIDRTSSKADDGRRVVVIGKIIIDQYGDPATRSSNNFTKITVGGGGPQAAFGAAAALACRDHYFRAIGLQNWNQQYTLALD